MPAPWRLNPDRQAAILELLAEGPMLGKQVAIEMDLGESYISRGMKDLMRAGLVAHGYSLTPKGRERLRNSR